MHEQQLKNQITFSKMSIPSKALATCIIVTLAIGMLGALGQIIIHDIIPTFIEESRTAHNAMVTAPQMTEVTSQPDTSAAKDRGDLFADLDVN